MIPRRIVGWGLPHHLRLPAVGRHGGASPTLRQNAFCKTLAFRNSGSFRNVPAKIVSGFVLVLILATPAAFLHAQETPADPAPPEALQSVPDAPPAAAEEPAPIVAGEAFVNANAAFEAGRFGEAITLYQLLLEGGFENGHLHYNLGNAYLRNGELGQAIASYRRSLIFLPRDQDARANLEFARKSAKDALAPPEPSATLKTLFFWHYGLSRSELGTIVVVLNLLLWAVLVLRIYRRASEYLRWLFMLLLLLLVTTGTSLAVRHLWPQPVAVIVPQEIDVRSGTNVTAVVLFKLHAGTEVRVVDRREETLRIALPEEGRGGWIEAEHAELVTD